MPFFTRTGCASIRQNVWLHAAMLMLITVSIINAFSPHFFWEHVIFENHVLHAVIEAFGALAAIIMAILLIQILQYDYSPNYMFISLSFLAMGAWDLLHACLTQDHGFVLTHSLALLWGGALFALAWFPWSDYLKKHAKCIVMVVLLLLAVTFGLVLTDHSFFPSMLAGGDFTPAAKAINLVGGILFLAGFVKLYLDYRRASSIGLLLLAIMALLSGLAGMVFPFFEVWSGNWWLWHVLRLIGYALVLAFMMLTYQKLYQQRESSLKEVQDRHEQMLSLFNGIDDFLYVADPDNYEILYANEATRRQNGEDVIGKKCFQAIHQQPAPCPFCSNEQILTRKGHAHIWEYQNEATRDWFRCFDKAIRWSDGRWVRFQLAMNINTIKENERKYQRVNAELTAFNKMAIGREKRMIELKQIINQLSIELGKEPPYDTKFADHE